ncbi:D-Ala-D-Ala carboxypeptidase family metallohydrolase [Thiohalomonas denitrificans]|uniref:D-Ala-D-Ala carboxypeptidase family metallohydrolase n=1 Tax=Thiohalomonas denitrificans TaxID=415747 RepID=UPI0026F16072|nr:D-Ala-D-Ala carboxypeptidase family metallohydrolase [Thiohalomonas denitrificans]
MSGTQLTKNFHLDEFLRSQTAVRHGIDMRVAEGGPVYSNLRRLCVLVLQPLRDALGPVTVTSGYRPPALNRKIGGARNSQHRYGLAADIVVSGYTSLEVARWLRDHGQAHDQLIHEFGEWAHVSIPDAGRSPRNERLTTVKLPRLIGKPRTVYVPGLYAVDAALAQLGRRAA